jgi:hypothetical protein
MPLKLDGVAPITDLYSLLWNIDEDKRNRQRLKEDENYKKQLLYNQIEDEDRMKAEKQNQREDLMSTSTFNVKSIMPKVKSLVADKQFLASGNASHYVMGDSTFSTKGGRRTRRHKRSGHKKRSGKRSGHKRSVHKSRRR